MTVYCAFPRTIFCILSLLVFEPCPALSQQPGEFYENNYAASPNVGGAALQGDQVPVPQGNNAVQPRTAPDAARTAQVVSAGGAEVLDPSTSMSVELYVNSKDRAHVMRSLQSVLKLIDTNKAIVTRVTHIGDYRNIDATTEATLRAKGVAIIAIDAPPPDLKITTSPAWIMSNFEGRYVIEGSNEIDRFIGNFGEFVMPNTALPVVTPTPGPQMVGF